MGINEEIELKKKSHFTMANNKETIAYPMREKLNAKKCCVPICTNDSSLAPKKSFFSLPVSTKLKWCKALAINCPKRVLYICEDHLNLEDDLENYLYWKTVKGRAKLKARLPKFLTSHLDINSKPQPSTSSCNADEVSFDWNKSPQRKLSKGIQLKPKKQMRKATVEEYFQIVEELPSTQEPQDCPRPKLTKKKEKMPSCVFKTCKNQSTTMKKDCGVSYHRFPHPGHEKREAWIKIVKKNRNEYTWLPTHHTLICSDHFKKEDVYVTKTGRVYLKKCAVPYDNSCSKTADGVESKDESKDADNACHGCEKPFSGFVYECIQCDYRMCAECDEAGLHKDHYVLRVPAHCSKSEVEMVMARVRTALQDVKLEPPPGEDQRVPGDSDDEPEPDLEPTVEVKMEAEIDEYDPLQAVTKAEVPVEVKTEPPEADETAGPVPVTCVRVGNVSRTTPDTSYVDLNTSIHMKMTPSTVKIEPPDEEPSTSQFVPTVSTQRQFAGKRPPGGEGPEGGTKEAKQKRQKKKVT